MNARKQYLRAADIAAMTGMSVRTVRRWIAEEILPSTKLRGARIVDTADLETVLCGSCGTSRDTCGDGEENDDNS